MGLLHLIAPDTAIDYRVEGNDVWLALLLKLRALMDLRLFPSDHYLKYLDCLLKVLGAGIGFDHGRKNNCVGPDSFNLAAHSLFIRVQYLSEDLLCELDPPVLDAGINKAAKSDVIIVPGGCRWDFALVLSENLESFLHLSQVSVRLDEDSNLNLLVRLLPRREGLALWHH